MIRVQRERSQLLIIDVQEKLLPAVHQPDRVVTICRKLMQAAKLLGVPMTVSEQYPQGIGATVATLREEIGNEVPVFSKVHFSCLRDEALRDRLQGLRTAEGRNQVILTGIESHICVTQTAIDLVTAGMTVVVAADGVSSRSEASRELALHRLRAGGVVVADSEMIIFEWLDQAGSADFKAMLPLLK